MAHQPSHTSASERDLSKAHLEILRNSSGRKDNVYSNKKCGNAVFCHDESPTLSAEIHGLENDCVSSTSEAMLKTLSIRNQNLPRRPKYGSGPSIKLRTNFFNVQLNPDTEIFRYVVSISNLNDKQKGKRRRLIELLLEDPLFRAAQSSSPLATDFAGLLVTITRLKFAERTSEGREFKEFRIRYKHEGQATAREDDPQYQVRIELTGSNSWKTLMEYLNSPFSVTNFDKEAAITVINIILRQHPISNSDVFSGAKSTKFYPLTGGEEANIDRGLIALKGYYASARTTIGRLLVNVNVCTSAFFRDGRVDLLMYLFPGPDFAEGFLKKRRISTDYLGSKRYRVIEGFARHPESKKFLSVHEAMIHVTGARYPSGKVSIADWFKDEHRQGKPLLKPNLPLILAGTSTIGDNISVPCWLPAEECRLVPGQPYGEKLTPQQTTKMLEFAALPPAENARRIVAEADRVLGLNRSNEFLRKFGLGIVNRMIIVEGRKLKGPNVVYQKTLPATNGSWNLRGAILKEKGNISNWTYLTVRMRMGKPEERRTASKKTMDNFRDVMRTHGFSIQDYTGQRGGVVVNLNDNWDDIDQRIENTLATVKRDGIRVLLVILDREDTYTYSRIKFFADTKYGIHTVHAVATKMMTDKNPDSSPQYLANLALKFNLKLGGVNHTLPDDRLSFLQQGKTMVVGMDVVHPSPGQIKGGPSIVAVVASINKDPAQWPASLRTQQRGSKGATELVQEGLLEQMVIERLRLWQIKNGGSLPERILVYRDGVSESQYEQVVHTEIPAFYSAYAKLSKASVEVAFIVVGKRHHTRFFPTNIKETDLSYNQYRKGNPLPGTVVDRGITMENGWDFFLQAHESLQGTARPAHYVVLRNDFKDMGADVLENITHDLCYLFGRATRSISVVPPARYADLACERGKQYLYKYLTIRPDMSNAHDRYDPTLSPWTRSVHEGESKHPLVDTMFYI